MLQVTSGHRITLTYNLYVVRGLGHLAGWSDALDPTTLPLYKTLQAALKEPDFFRKGRVLAIYLTHAYAHTSKHSNFLPASLKGAGMSLYETALALGLRSLIAPVVWLGGVGSVRAGKCYYKRWDLFDPAGFKPFTTGEKYGDEESVPSDWGLPIPIGNYTLVNGVMDSWEAKKDSKKKEKMEEPQMADLVVSSVFEHDLQNVIANVLSLSLSLVWQRMSTRDQVLSCCDAHSHPTFPSEGSAGGREQGFLGRHQAQRRERL